MTEQEQYDTKFSLVSVKDGLINSINEFLINILSKTDIEPLLVTLRKLSFKQRF